MIQETILTQPPYPISLPVHEELPTEDGIPIESPWHRAEISLLIESIHALWQSRDDYYAGGNMFVYFSRHQIRKQDYRGPDFFLVAGVDGTVERKAWVVWEEGGRYPDLIIELLSPTTAESDITSKKALYERVFRTPEYYCYNPDTGEFWGWHYINHRYEALAADGNGRFWSGVLQTWIGPWQGIYNKTPATWLRLFDEEGVLIPLQVEAAESRAEQEKATRLALETQLAQLQEELNRLKGQP